ncbi:unnamed protein product [marine sediment metagenome]|uniref:Uncharacterized protein n=1 Tax=marine sediment metagenome TaxID=412755 RepID=X0SSL6_9ZZZZ
MNKKILIGSIIAVAILVLVSFTGVVGYQTTQHSTIAKASPLFTIRSSRAIDEESKDLTCEYVGKGSESGIFIPERDRKLSQIYKIIKKISQIDTKSNRFINLLMNQVYQVKPISNENLHELMNKLSQIRNNPEGVTNNIDELDNILIGGWTIFNPICLLIILGFMSIFGFWLSIMSIYAGVTCDPCCYIPLPETLGI